MKLFAEIIALYGVYAFVASVLVARYTREDRLPNVIVAVLMPILMLVSMVWGTFLLIFRRSPRVRPCPIGLADAERAVAKRRREMFGGELMPVKFASDWARLYGVTLEMEAQKVQQVARRLSPRRENLRHAA